MTQPDLLVYSASGLNEPNFRVVVPANKGFVPDGRVQVKVIKPKLGGFMFHEATAGVKDSAVIFADTVQDMKEWQKQRKNMVLIPLIKGILLMLKKLMAI